MRVQTTSEGKTPQGAVAEVAILPITIDGADLANLTLTTTAGWSVSGSVTTENGTLPEGSPDRFRLAARPVDSDTAPTVPPTANPDSGRMRDDWRFVVTGIFGPARLRATVPDGWTVKAIRHEGVDIADTVVERPSGEQLAGVQVIVSTGVTSVSGQLVDDNGVPLADGTVVLCAADPEKWFEESRWVRAARPDQQGR